jgi:hypothetical protein
MLVADTDTKLNLGEPTFLVGSFLVKRASSTIIGEIVTSKRFSDCFSY